MRNKMKALRAELVRVHENNLPVFSYTADFWGIYHHIIGWTPTVSDGLRRKGVAHFYAAAHAACCNVEIKVNETGIEFIFHVQKMHVDGTSRGETRSIGVNSRWELCEAQEFGVPAWQERRICELIDYACHEAYDFVSIMRDIWKECGGTGYY